MQAESMSAMPIRCDVADRDDIKAAVAATVGKFGTVDILVNNAAIGYEEGDVTTWPSIEDTTEEYFRSVQDVNLIGTLLFMQACYPYLKQHGGKIINLASGLATEGTAHLASYTASKEAVRGLSRVAAKEWGPHGINVNVIAPFALSPALSKIRDEQPEQFTAWLQNVPLRYAGDCEHDVGPVAVFLASEEGRYLTGHTLMVDGGMMVLR
jgi:NAD(P)-dependent dehydrogenase (short-subunit alcohol dehydrogenase family)